MARMALGLGMAILAGGMLPAAAQEWSGQITPYVWGVGLGGDLTPFSGAPTLSFDRSPAEVIKDSRGAFFVSGLARRDRLVLLGDLSWSESAKDGLLPPGVPAEGKLTQRSLTLLAGWRVHDDQRLTMDALAGLRAWHIRGRVAVAGGAVQLSPGKDFVDPIVALRANVKLAPDWSAIFYADVGGFGAGSEQTSQFLATLNYRVNDRFYVSAGYRQLNVDYRSGGTRLDVTMAGPILGATWRF
ncbi:hypothetical protein GB880_008555 [Paracoccus sp. SMMA_5_TC]|nr:hypothetical protein [Paracoccus sp. SMMA_5_TC]UXU79865.1 hypothetical protein GB880_008555 [Paracoccus sp. SMMA_5_TC]